MAQTQKPTNKLYVACATAIKGDVFDKFVEIGLETGSMVGFDETTNALTAESTASGLARTTGTVSLQTTTVTNDTVRITKTFTSGATETENGFGVFAQHVGGNMLGWCSFNAGVALQSGDTLACTFDCQFKLGA